MISIEQAVLAYVAAFNENDEAEQRRLIESCFAENGTITADHEHMPNREAVLAHIAAFRRRCPQDRGILTSGIDQHHNWFRFTAHAVRPDGTIYSPALDVGEVGADGRIVRIISFQSPLPPAPAT